MENYPQIGTNFWGSPENNYGFGSSNISDAISRHPAMHTTPMPVEQTSNLPEINAFNDSYGGYVGNNVLGSDQQITMPNSQKSTVWDKFKNWAENTGDAMQAGAVGYATGATLGNFDEAMGAATAAVTLNPNNYAMGRDATRQLQADLSQRHPYIYGGAEFVGTMNTPMHLAKETTFANRAFNALTDTLNASAGYAENWDDFGTNLVVNGIANAAGFPIDVIPFTRAAGRPLVQFGKKFIKQGINSSADKMKNMYYKEDEDEKKYY